MDYEPKNSPLVIQQGPDEDYGQAVARTLLRPGVQAANTRQVFLPENSVGLGDHVDALEAQIAAVQSGDMRGPEAMLVAQAAALDGMFHDLAKRAHNYLRSEPDRADLYLKSALKAQAQCVQAIRVLSEVKNPRAVFVRQTNVANGPQQINNHSAGVDSRASARTHAHETAEANELLTDDREKQHAATLDGRAKGRAGRKNKAVEAVAEVDRAAHHTGQVQDVAERA
ncbi:hypothetical protein [Burkholderia ubonensis]|uniref:hypothetical protein n=1 Tax=Burkholderia ubonensis TaxID=101571 RepID=UPI0007536A87|nr:hypothetical protein [Burkholderia ubonensis]KVZ52988.1 hypothetical protein WL16_14740 [Burkholderia ubonensis]